MTSYTGMSGNFSVNFSPGPSPSHKRSASEARLSGADPFSAGASRSPTHYNQMATSFPTSSGPDLTGQSDYGRAVQPDFEGLFSEAGSSTFTNYSTPVTLPLLRIPEDTYIPGLSYTQDNSPWCSSASDSTYSTQSESSRSGRRWGRRARSASINTAPDWLATIPQYSPHGLISTPQDLRDPGFDAMLDYETPYVASPHMTPPSSTRQLLDVPNSFGGYYMESVGTPAAIATYNKPLAHPFQASPTRISDTGLGSTDRRQRVGSPQQLEALTSLSAPNTSYPPQSSHLAAYISSYWEEFDQAYPIIHRGTFDPIEDTLLTSAMAAIGTQYHHSTKARQRGVELNKFCRESIDHVSSDYPDISVDFNTLQNIFHQKRPLELTCA
jgi:hypothetical protein